MEILFKVITIVCMVSTLITCNASSKFPAILVFGDSTVDSGNNNYIPTVFRANYLPYGREFPNHTPTGRFSNGKLVPDLLASALGIKDSVPPSMDSTLSNENLVTGVSFASAACGIDDLTSLQSNVLSLSKQVSLFKDYTERVTKIVGDQKAKEIISNALVLVSVGTNDWGLNFYGLPTRRSQFNESGYQDFLLNKLEIFIKDLYDQGCRKMAISGLPPLGCLPMLKQLHINCKEDENQNAIAYNNKLSKLIDQMQANLSGSKIAYSDSYTPLIDIISTPSKYGFVETKIGCCGVIQVLCIPSGPTCEDSSKFVFWDAVHPTEAVYRYIAKQTEVNVIPKLS